MKDPLALADLFAKIELLFQLFSESAGGAIWEERGITKPQHAANAAASEIANQEAGNDEALRAARLAASFP